MQESIDEEHEEYGADRSGPRPVLRDQLAEKMLR